VAGFRWSASSTANRRRGRQQVHCERPGPQLGRHRGDRRTAIGPVKAAAGEQPHGLALPAHDQAVSIVLDLVHPVGPGGRLGSDAGLDKAIGADASGHACQNDGLPPAGGVARLPRNGSRGQELSLVLVCERAPCPVSCPSPPTTSPSTWS
jgi:hypothetical protein